MVEVERRRAFRRRVEEFEDKFEYSVGWKNEILQYIEYDAWAFILSKNDEISTFEFTFSREYGITSYNFSMSDEDWGFGLTPILVAWKPRDDQGLIHV